MLVCLIVSLPVSSEGKPRPITVPVPKVNKFY